MRDTLAMEALRVIMSHFCRARGIFHDDCFVQKQIGEAMVFILKKPPSGDYGAVQLYDLLEYGVAECLDRRCLRSISLCIVKREDGALLEELLIECEEISVREYPSMSTADAIRELTRKHRLLVQTLSPLPKEIALKVRVSLIGDKTPYRAWTPPFFQSPSHQQHDAPMRQLLDGNPVELKVGKVISDRETYIVSLRSLHDTLEKLTPREESQLEASQIVFDPAFTLDSSVDTHTSLTKTADVILYQTIKSFVASDKTPSMKRTFEAHRHADMPTIRRIFQQLCDEGVLEQRGTRFYPAKLSMSSASRAVKDPKPIKKHTRNGPVVAQLMQNYEAVQPTSKIRRHAVLPANVQVKRRHEVSKQVVLAPTQRFGRMISAPIVQKSHPTRIHDTRPRRVGGCMSMASHAVVQTAHEPTRRRQKISSGTRRKV